jgi:DNA invertase Pin-like site-specific DNA recombinase
MMAVIYTRNRSGTGEDRQLERCRTVAAEQGWEVIAACSDQDVSALNLDRPGLQSAMNLVRSRGCDILVADAPEVLTRSASGVRSIVADVDAVGVAVHAGQFSSSDAAGVRC